MAGPDDRLIATMGLMARDVDNEALIALRQATRMLASRGLGWGDVARMIAGRPAAERPDTAAGSPKGGATHRAPEPEPKPKPKPKPEPEPAYEPEPDLAQRRADRRNERARTYSGSRPRRTVKGIDIPESVRGRVVILGEKRTRSGDEYLVISVDNDQVVWGPLMVFEDHLRTMLHYTSDDWITAWIEQPSNSLYHPIVVDAERTG